VKYIDLCGKVQVIYIYAFSASDARETCMEEYGTPICVTLQTEDK
jgi:hypothetical protein